MGVLRSGRGSAPFRRLVEENEQLRAELERAKRELAAVRAELEARTDEAWFAAAEEQAAAQRAASARLTRDVLVALAARMGVSGPLLDEALAALDG